MHDDEARTREYYIECRKAHDIGESVRLTAEHEGISVERVCEHIQLDAQHAQAVVDQLNENALRNVPTP